MAFPRHYILKKKKKKFPVLMNHDAWSHQTGRLGHSSMTVASQGNKMLCKTQRNLKSLEIEEERKF